MNRLGLDLCLILILALDFLCLFDPNATGELAFTILIVNTLIVLMYIGFVIGPHYIKKISNDDLRRVVRNLVIYVPLCVFFFLMTSSGHIDLDDPVKARMEMTTYFLIGLSVIMIVSSIIAYCYHKKKEKETA